MLECGARLLAPLPVRAAVTVTPAVLEAAGLPSSLRLSGIDYDASRDAWWLVAARSRHLMVVDREGTVLEWARLDADRHPQAEGIAFDREAGPLAIVDEGVGGSARLTVYSLNPPP